MKVEGVVNEVRENLGAFVDIGTERFALLHVSGIIIFIFIFQYFFDDGRNERNTS